MQRGALATAVYVKNTCYLLTLSLKILLNKLQAKGLYVKYSPRDAQISFRQIQLRGCMVGGLGGAPIGPNLAKEEWPRDPINTKSGLPSEMRTDWI